MTVADACPEPLLDRRSRRGDLSRGPSEKRLAHLAEAPLLRQRIVVLSDQRSDFSFGSAWNLVVDFVDRGTARGLDTTGCIDSVVLPPIEHSD